MYVGAGGLLCSFLTFIEDLEKDTGTQSWRHIVFEVRPMYNRIVEYKTRT